MKTKKLKTRPDPLSEGSLKAIYTGFFEKLREYKPHTMTLYDWMEHLFDTKNREIHRYRAKEPFKMPGLLLLAPNYPVQGLGYREVPQNAEVWVRTDERDVNVELEWLGGQGKKDQVFRLSRQEWRDVQPKLKLTERRKKLE